MKDELGDRMKAYEGAEAQRRLPHDQPMIARIDGRGFSKFTRGFEKPFDATLTFAMDRTTMALVEETHASIGYTQSDEITLIWDVPNENGQRFFDDRVQKLCSVLSGHATSEFTFALLEAAQMKGDLDLKAKVQSRKPHFDCRLWTVPDQGEAANTLLWRAQDAKKNAVSIYARQYVSHKQLQGLDQAGMLAAADAAGAPDINVACSTGEIFGRYFQRTTEERALSEAERMRIPEKNRPDPDATFTRSRVAPVDIAYFGDVGDQAARIEAIFS